MIIYVLVGRDPRDLILHYERPKRMINRNYYTYIAFHYKIVICVGLETNENSSIYKTNKKTANGIMYIYIQG
jgi:hypothetical protein